MKQHYEIINKLQSTDSRLEKENIIREEANNDNQIFFKGLRYALDSTITFGVKKVPSHGGPDGQGLPWSVFEALLQQLQTRELTGNDAKSAIEFVMSASKKIEWNNWYRLILIKDLKSGLSEVTVNRVCKDKFPQFTIPVFEVQLAKDCVDDEGNVDDSLMSGNKIIQSKLDGVRCISIMYPNGTVDQFTRNGKELVNFEKIKGQLSAAARWFTCPMVLDGEVMGASFQDLMKQARRKSNVQADDSVLNLFDIMPLSEFNKKYSTLRQIERLNYLSFWYEKNIQFLDNVNVLGHEIVNLNTEQGKTRLYAINKIALEQHYEGIMLKDPDSFYECKRSKNWLKMKPFIEESLVVVRVEEGAADSKFVGTMGALVCEGLVDGKRVTVNVGSGFSVQQRAQIWADITNSPVSWVKKVKGTAVSTVEHPANTMYIGQVVEVRADALTKSQDGDTWSMRFPRFKCWRGFAPGEKN